MPRTSACHLEIMIGQQFASRTNREIRDIACIDDVQTTTTVLDVVIPHVIGGGATGQTGHAAT